MNAGPALCYLCGQPLREPISSDHVPMKQLYESEIRKAHSPNLLTISVHDQCNKSYQRDEDYFVTALMPHARGSYAGDAMYKRALERYRGGEKVGLVRKVLADFDPRPSGLVLSGNQVLQRFDGDRIKRIAWKIVRGLYFHHQNNFLPDVLITGVTLTLPDQVPPEHFKAFMSLPDNEPHGQYPAVFDYRFQNITEGQANARYWAMLLWDRIIITVVFRDPTCPCGECQPPVADNSRR
jgi:hypothetical protein